MERGAPPRTLHQPSHPRDALIVQRRSESRSSYYDLAKQGTTIYAVTLTRYRNGGAVKYLAEVRAEFTRCRTVARTSDFDNTKMTLTYRMVSSGIGGDESLAHLMPGTEDGFNMFVRHLLP